MYRDDVDRRREVLLEFHEKLIRFESMVLCCLKDGTGHALWYRDDVDRRREVVLEP